MQKNIIFKKSSKRNQNLSRYYYNSIITNLKFQHKPKISSFQKSSYKNRPIIYITLGPKSFKLLYSIMYLNTINILALVGKANKLDTRPRYGTFDKAYGMNIKEHK
jgi:hypothetical protein